MTKRMGGSRLGNAGRLHRPLESPLERLVVQVMTPDHTAARVGSVEWVACGNTQNHAQDVLARGYLRSSA